LIADLAEALGKSEDEIRQFLQALWQQLPLAVEVEPPFVRYLDAKIEGVRSTLEAEIKGLRSTLEAEINGLRIAMEQGFKRAEERDEMLRREMEQGFKRAEERDEILRREIEQRFQQAAERDEAIRRELRQEIEALRGEIQRLERWFLAFAIPVLLMLAGIIVQNFLK
jgi:GAF domain-containing protein